MHICNICNFSTSTYNRLKQHNKSKKHLLIFAIKKNTCENIYIPHKYICDKCNKEYKYQSGLSRHYKLCSIIKKNNEDTYTESDLLITIEKLKCNNELNKKDLETQLKLKEFEKQLELKELENKHLKSQMVNIPNSQTNVTVNNVKISKLQYLNNNFSNVIDINTFIDNYKNKYGLTNDQTKILLENYQSDGINACISAMVYYLKKSAVQQYKELNGLDIKMENIILPFLLSDKSLREHFEKSVNGKWDKTTMCDNIKRLVTITNDQVYKHHQQFMDINGPQRKRIINGILKASCYSVLSQITDPELYKEMEDKEKNKKTIDTKDTKDVKDETNIKEKDTKDEKCINDSKDNITDQNVNKNDQNLVNNINQYLNEYSEDEDDNYLDDNEDDDFDIYDCDSDDE
jgi:predicted Holliday junction resolvase-like endonuclease